MPYFRFRFSGEIAFRRSEPPEEITLDFIKKMMNDRDAVGAWRYDDPEEIDDVEMAHTVSDYGRDPHDFVQGRLPGFL